MAGPNATTMPRRKNWCLPRNMAATEARRWVFAPARRVRSQRFQRIGDPTGWRATTRNNFRPAIVMAFSSPSTVHGIGRHTRKVGTTLYSSHSPVHARREVAKSSRTVSPERQKLRRVLPIVPQALQSDPMGRSMYPTTFADVFTGSSIGAAPQTTQGAPLVRVPRLRPAILPRLRQTRPKERMQTRVWLRASPFLTERRETWLRLEIVSTTGKRAERLARVAMAETARVHL